MPKKESIQHKLDRVRPPRVHITYDVEVGGAIENKELPFVLGVLGDFSGQPEEPLRKMRTPRQRLSDLLSKMDGNDKLETILNEIASDTNAQAQLSSALGLDKPSGETPAKEESQ